MPANANRILVVGTGPVGLIAALSLSRAGFAVDLAGPDVNLDDRRTTALMVPALNHLERLGVLGEIEAGAAPLAVMRIVDATSRLIRSPMVTFRASEIGERYFGLNIPNRHLNKVLADAASSDPNVTRRRSLVESWRLEADRAVALLADGGTIGTPLAVAADGRSSPARDAAGIRTVTHDYPQAALVLNFAHTRGHGSVSTEFHTETGPFTQVPLPGDRSSLVWVVRPETAEELTGIDDAALSRRIEDRMQSMLGRVAVEPGRQVYPLSAKVPLSFGRNRVALLGEAAHVFPPIGAQGLNLGIRDVVDLVESVAANPADPGDSRVLAAYERKRRPDILARTGAVDLLNRSLLSDLLPAQFARTAGLGLLGALGPLRAFFMREGMRPGSGFAAALDGLREQIRR
ncbi:UbiH/UbiF family hydroxylase [bacterium]|nr:UbiH/UbiF family hydroxylase [bacterium]